MTQVDFYTHVSNKLETACLLCVKALAQKKRVMILTPDAETTARVDHALWTYKSTTFIPHVRARHPLASVTPVIVDHDLAGVEHDDVLFNLRFDTTDGFSRFQRLIEIVGTDEDDVLAARNRYRFYRDRGYELRTHDLS